MHKRLSRRNVRYAIAHEAIRTDGRRATVAFDVLELDKRGNVTGSRRESYELEKQDNGFVGLRPR